jgi:hypothetical protein
MTDSEDTTELCRSGDYRIVEMFDMALLVWPGGEMIVGDHCYTDPQCAVVNIDRGWCVSGGEGLEIRLFADGLPKGSSVPDSQRVSELGLWRHPDLLPDGQRYWFVSKIWLREDDLIGALVHPSRNEEVVYEVDVRTLRWARV